MISDYASLLEAALLDAVAFHAKDPDRPWSREHLLDHVRRSEVFGGSLSVGNGHDFLDAVDTLVARRILAWGSCVLPPGTPMGLAPWMRTGPAAGPALLAHWKRRKREEKERFAEAEAAEERESAEKVA